MGAELSIPIVMGCMFVLPIVFGVGVMILLQPDEAAMHSLQRECAFINDRNAWQGGLRTVEPRRTDYRW